MEIQRDTNKVKNGRSWPRKLAMITGVLAVLILTAAVIINSFYLDTLINWTLSRVQNKTNIQIEYEKMKGNLFSGRFEFKGIRVKRTGDAYTNFNLKVDSADLEIIYISLLKRERRYKSLMVNGVTGLMTRVKIKPWHLRKINNFTIENFSVNNARLTLKSEYLKTEKKSVDVYIKSANSKLLRRRYVVLDLFFKSNVEGAINGHPVKITTHSDVRGRKTEWQVDALDVESLRIIVNKRLQWLKSGTVSVSVNNIWKSSESADFQSNWTFKAHKPVAEVPESYSKLKALLVKPVVKYLSQNKDDYDISFGLTLNDRQFAGHASLDAAKLWKVVFKGLIKQLTRGTVNRIQSKFQKYKNRAKNILK